MKRNKIAKEEVKNTTTGLPDMTRSVQGSIDRINETPDNQKLITKHSISLVVNEKLIFQLEDLTNKFKGKTKAYFTYPSKVQLFETGCLFVEHLYKDKNQYHIAPPDFIKHIGRKGRRPVSPEHEERKGNGQTLYLNINSDILDSYYNIIYSFLKLKEDIGNQYYSPAFFFKDFIDILEKHFTALCKYEKDHPRQ